MTFQPGTRTSLATFPKRPTPGRLYGLPVAGGDWVTVRVDVDRQGSTYRWCSRLTPGAGEGNRQQFVDWATALGAT